MMISKYLVYIASYILRLVELTENYNGKRTFIQGVIQCNNQEHRKALKFGGPQRVNRVDLCGKNLIPMENL